MTSARDTRSRRGVNRWLLLSPSMTLLGLFVVAPVAVMLMYSFFTDAGAGVVRPILTIDNWGEFFDDPYYRLGLWQTLRVACGATAICALLGYPASYFVATAGGCGGTGEVAQTAYEHDASVAQARVIRSWAGIVENTPDGRPVLCRLSNPGNVVVATMSSVGFGLSPATGRAVMELVRDGACTFADLSALHLSRFDALPADWRTQMGWSPAALRGT